MEGGALLTRGGGGGVVGLTVGRYRGSMVA